MIQSWASPEGRGILEEGSISRRWPVELQAVMRRKLRMIDEARELKDIGNIPGNRLKKLKGDRRGQYSIRVNDQWRICFRWTGADAEEVEIVDYHS
jgi:toxin HigB-1